MKTSSELVVYKASAGSGKTFTLAVEYIKLLIQNPRAYRNILAVTFTNKATTEMKKRILEQLYGIYIGDKESAPYLENVCKGVNLPEDEVRAAAGKALNYIIHDYSHFRVETIDSFFQSVIRNLARELELNANLNIELNNSEVLSDAVDAMIEKLDRNSPVLTWLLEYIEERIQSDRRWNVSDEIKSFGRNIFDEGYIEKGAGLRNKLKDKDYAITSQIEQYIQSSGKKCFLSEKDSEGHIIPGTVPKEAECGLVLGGDGTLIRAVRDLGERSLPLLGINLGTLGYLTDVDLEDFESALDHLFSETPVIEERMMLEGSFRNSRKDMAMNDIVIAREGKVRIVSFHIYVNGALLNTYHADGVIISTPTGSTGYNLSAGGPIVEPTAQMIVITPICSHALNTSSIVLSADDLIEVEVCEGRYGRQEQVSLCFDGAEQTTLVTGERVCIKRSSHTAKLIKLSKESFMKTMRKKMKGN